MAGMGQLTKVSCEELCSADEYCYIPTWPFTFLGDWNGRPYYSRSDNDRRPVLPDGDHPPYGYGLLTAKMGHLRLDFLTLSRPCGGSDA
jgi:hypothetical protein